MTEESKEKFKLNPKNKKLIIIVACIFVVAAIATTVIIVVLSHRETVGDILELGDRYMSEMDYESAIREYKRAIETDPKSEDAYLKLAEAYIAIGDIDSAIETLEDGYEVTQSNRILERLNELREELHTPEYAKELSVASEPDKLTYYVGDTLDLSGLILKVKYKDGNIEEIDDGYICDIKMLEDIGEVEVTVKYGKAETAFKVTVSEPSIVEITVSVVPEKLTYFVGETLDTSGMILTVLYENETEVEIREGFVCDTSVLDTAGRQNVTVEYNGVTTKFSVTVKIAEVVDISINTLPTIQNYLVNGELDITGLSIDAVYEDGRTETIYGGFVCTPRYLKTIGDQIIKVEYDGKETEFTVNVKETTDTIEFNGHSYRVIYDENIGWHDAEAECEKMGGHLATITSEEENMFVYNLVSALGISCWIGGTDEEVEAEWKWVTGEEWVYDASDFDNRDGRQNYLVINYVGNAIWDDQSEKDGSILCNTRGYVCEWER